MYVVNNLKYSGKWKEWGDEARQEERIKTGQEKQRRSDSSQEILEK